MSGWPTTTSPSRNTVSGSPNARRSSGRPPTSTESLIARVWSDEQGDGDATLTLVRHESAAGGWHRDRWQPRRRPDAVLERSERRAGLRGVGAESRRFVQLRLRIFQSELR